MRLTGSFLLGLLLAVLAAAIAAPAAGAAVSVSAALSSGNPQISYAWSAPDTPTGTVQLTFTYVSGTQATAGDTWVFNTSADTQSTASGLVTVNAVTPVSAGCTTLCVPSLASSPAGVAYLPDGNYTVQMSFPSAGGTSQSNTASISGVDGPTARPTVTSPTSSSGRGPNTFSLDYNLNEAPTPGSVVASFVGGGSCTTVSLTLTDVTSQATTISYATPLSSSGVNAGTGAFVRGCTYTMTLSFQDRALPAGSTVVTGLLVPAVPSAPAGVSAVRGSQEAMVSWSAPAANGSAITSYVVTASPGGATCGATAPATTCTVTGLTNGTPYTFTARAVNAVGTGAASAASAAVTPADVPGAPAPSTAVVPLPPAVPPVTPSPTPTPDAQTPPACGRRDLTVRARRAVAGVRLASCARLAVTDGSRIRLAVPKAARRVCRVEGARVVGLRAGRCVVTVTVVPRSGPKKARTVTVTVIKR